MAVWKVSYVVKGSDQAGGIVNLDQIPVTGEILRVGELQLEILEVLELIPPKGNFHYLHVTCQTAKKPK